MHKKANVKIQNCREIKVNKNKKNRNLLYNLNLED